MSIPEAYQGQFIVIFSGLLLLVLMLIIHYTITERIEASFRNQIKNENLKERYQL